MNGRADVLSRQLFDDLLQVRRQVGNDLYWRTDQPSGLPWLGRAIRDAYEEERGVPAGGIGGEHPGRD